MNYDRQLQTIGKGWFILRLSNDLLGSSYDLKTGYSEKSVREKESTYRQLLPCGGILVRRIKKDGASRLRAEGVNAGVNVGEVLDQLEKKISKKPASLKLKTKACKGIHFGDVANSAVRCVLSNLSSITDEELYAAEEFFDWRCPYTGRNLKAEILGDRKNVSVDHIVPQNREYCGINVFGNLVYADKSANQKKQGMSAEEFIRSLPNVSDEEKERRIQKIKDFQSAAGYDPAAIRDKLSKVMDAFYAEVESILGKEIKKAKK